MKAKLMEIYDEDENLLFEVPILLHGDPEKVRELFYNMMPQFLASMPAIFIDILNTITGPRAAGVETYIGIRLGEQHSKQADDEIGA